MVSVKLADLTAIFLKVPYLVRLLIFDLGYEISIHERAKRQREIVLLLIQMRAKTERCMCEAAADANASTHGLDHEECRDDGKAL